MENAGPQLRRRRSRQRRSEGGVAVAEDPGCDGVETTYDGQTFKLKHGAVVVAAITSCTNTSNPSVMIGAGLVAKKAHAARSYAQAVGEDVAGAGFDRGDGVLQKSGIGGRFRTRWDLTWSGFGCTTCIGNSGPLPDEISKSITDNDLVVASVLSGNRNFEGRINPDVKANYLASPRLVVAYAIAGTVDIDLDKDSARHGKKWAARLSEGHLADAAGG